MTIDEMVAEMMSRQREIAAERDTLRNENRVVLEAAREISGAMVVLTKEHDALERSIRALQTVEIYL